MANRFQWVTDGQQAGSNWFDQDLFDHPLAAVVPSLGSLTPGWLLVIPRVAAMACSELSRADRMNVLEFAKNLAKKVQGFGGDGYVLEHGAVEANTAVGCGVDQAHLHVVPLLNDFFSRTRADDSVTWRDTDPADPWAKCEARREYYLLSGARQSFIGTPKASQSQFFRRKVASALGMPHAWDYREWPGHENIHRTIEHFGGARFRHRAA